MRHSFSNVQFAVNRLAKFQSLSAAGRNSLASGMVNFVMNLIVMMAAFQPIYYKVMKANLLFLMILLSSFSHSPQCNAQIPTITTAGTFAVFTAAGAINNTGPTQVNGDLGTNAGAYNGFPPGIVTGGVYNENGTSAVTAVDVLAAYGSFAPITCDSVIGTTLGSGQILTPNTYCLGAASTLNGILTLDAQGDPDAIFIFKINGAFATGVMAQINLVNSASICNVYWQVGGQFTLGDNSIFYGTVINDGAAIILNNSYLAGRLLSVAGAITLTNTVIDNVCAAAMSKDVLAYSGTENTGNQAYTERLGMVFTVNSPITISELGAFDSNLDGLQSTIEVGIVRTDGTIMAGPISMSGSGDYLLGNHRMRAITPIFLPPGSYAVVAVGYSNLEQNGNSNLGDLPVATNDGGGLLTFNSALYGGVGFGLPTTADPSPNIFHAGTFKYSSVLPILQLTVNAVQLTNINDGVPESEDLLVCNTTDNNLFFTQFAETTGISPSANIKIQQQFLKNNVVFAPVDGIFPLSAYTTPFDRNVSLLNPNATGSLAMYFRAFYDANNNDIIDANECPGDWIGYFVNINDTVRPSVDCPANVVVTTSTGVNTDQLGGDCVAWVRGINIADSFDDCPNPVISYVISGSTNTSGIGDASGTYFYTGISTVTYTITDHGVPANTASCSFTVTVVDDEAPEIRCPQNVTLSSNPGLCSAYYTYDVAYDDNCYGVDANGFEDEFAPAFWNLSNSNGGNGTINTIGAPTSVVLTGSDFGLVIGATNNTDYCAAILGNYAGMMTFNWEYYSFDSGGPAFDHFGYVVDGVYTQLSNNAGGTIQSGSVSIMLNPGQQFCFRINSVDQGFGAAVTIAMAFTYMEDINPVLVQNLGLPSGSYFLVGTTNNVFTVTDNNDNTATCSFTVTVEDVENPSIICPADIEVELNPLQCDSVVVFDAIATDNCLGVTYEVSTSLESGDLFPVGTNIVVYQATDAVGNTATCSFEITIIDYFNSSLGCLNRHVSLDENCEALVDPFMVLTGYVDEFGDTLLGCLDLFIVNIKDPNGLNLGNTVDGDYLGKTLDYTISNPTHGFYCWGTLKIEDKLRPHVVCTNDTISCVQPLSAIIKPILEDNCPGGILVLLSETEATLQCDADFLKTITRVWSAKDKYGNLGDTCTQVIYIERTDLGGIDFPDHFTGSNALECGSFAADANGIPLVSVTGVPTLYGHNLYPFSQALICNGFVTFTDRETFTTDCKRIIIRTWEVGEWWCNSTNIQTWVQTIEIKDKEAPVIGNIANITVSTGTTSCSATFELPKAPVTDNCHTWTVKVSTGEDVLNTNGGQTTLSVGIHSVTYTATDFCGNQSSKTIRVSVIDRADPIAVCESRTVVSLKDDGTAWLFKETVDDGSFDECGPIELKIRRMTTTCDTTSTLWSDAVGFCCADAGQEVMVALQVTDQSGRTNQCMVIVEVQDKRIPTMTCPYNLTVDCSTPFDINDLGASFGDPVVGGGGCADLSDVTETYADSLNNCRIGILTRYFTLTHNGVTVGTCNQIITFVPDRPFNSSMIDWPRDTSFVNSLCTPFDLDPENLPEGYGMPQLNEEGVCDLVAFSYDQDVYSFTSNNACYKIVRHWTVINWCYYVNGILWQDTFDQVIVIMNTKGPTISSPTTRREVCSYNADCTPASIKLTAAANDDCTPASELRWRWTITLEDGSKRYGTGNDASGIYPFGNHSIQFEVEDKCGNITYTGYPFDVKSCKPPVAYCKQGLSTSLVPMDMDGDGIPEVEMSVLTPEYFDNGSQQSCGNTIQLSFSADVDDDTLIVDCGDLGLYEVELWVTDENGNQSYCSTFVDVQDNNNVSICPPAIIESNVQGRIHIDDDRGISDVTVKLASNEERIDITEQTGSYDFGLLPKGLQYFVSPEKNDDPLNGVSTLDLVMIQRHILGISKLLSPFQLIAADVNQDGKITAADLVILRKLILGIDSVMPGNKSWKFVWDGHLWADPTNPWSQPIPETYDIQKLTSNMDIKFTGIKLGDVNGNVVANIADMKSENRSLNALPLVFVDRQVTAGEVFRISINSEAVALIHGLQLTMKTAGLKVLSLEGHALEGMNSDNMNVVHSGVVHMSYAASGARVIEQGSALFVMEVEATEGGRLREMLTLSNLGLPAQAYLGDGLEVSKIELRTADFGQSNFDFEAGIVKPNPWNEVSYIPVSIPERGIVTLNVRDNTGKLILSKSIGLEGGQHQLELNRTMIGSTGSFIYAVTYNGETKYGKMIIID